MAMVGDGAAPWVAMKNGMATVVSQWAEVPVCVCWTLRLCYYPQSNCSICLKGTPGLETIFWAWGSYPISLLPAHFLRVFDTPFYSRKQAGATVGMTPVWSFRWAQLRGVLIPGLGRIPFLRSPAEF